MGDLEKMYMENSETWCDRAAEEDVLSDGSVMLNSL